jgi:glycosyltransferase involved in cell wall biosynthesis
MKGIEDVVQAFILIKNKKKDAKLWIVGTGEKSYVDHLKKYVRELGLTKDVFFWGFISNTKKLKLMSKAHILLHASVKEGWGLVVLEAASQGTPSIVYDVGSLKEVVKDNKTGRVMGENTPKSLADASLQLLDNKKKYRKFQNNGIDWVNSLNWVDETKKSLKLLGSKK